MIANKSIPSTVVIALALAALLAVTRVGHFGSTVSLPDASLAVFLLGGLWLGGRGHGLGYELGYFAALMTLAFGIDVYLAQTAVQAGWCLTPAYGGLVLTYALTWGAGRFMARQQGLTSLRFALLSLGTVAAAFLLSNLSFWAFSGYFGELGGVDYASAVARYFPPYLGSAALYLALGWGLQRLLAMPRNQVA